MIARRLEGVQIEHAADEILAMRTANSEAHASIRVLLLSTICATATPQSLRWSEIHWRT